MLHAHNILGYLYYCNPKKNFITEYFLSSHIFLCTMYLKRPALNSVDEEDSIEYADGDDYDDKDDGKDVISVFGGVLQVAVKCRELSGTPSNHPS